MANPLFSVTVNGTTEWTGAGAEHAGEIYGSFCQTRPTAAIELLDGEGRRQSYRAGGRPPAPLCERLASAIGARQNCIAAHNLEWRDRHQSRIEALAQHELPRGSGVDSGCKVDLDRSTADRIVITTAFHHMDENGYYDGWTEHTITVKPSFIGRFSLKISGRDRNGIKEYLSDLFYHALSVEGVD